MTTAFQPSAFQNNAFQIDQPPIPGDNNGYGGGGGSSTVKHNDYGKYIAGGRFYNAGFRSNPIERKGKLLRELYYFSLKEDTTPKQRRKIVSSIDAFLYPKDDTELERRKAAKYIVDTPPDIERINFEQIAVNQYAYDHIKRVLKDIKSEVKFLKAQSKSITDKTIDQYKQDEEAIILMFLMGG